MPEYLVKTIRDRNLVIEAERYHYASAEQAYEFFHRNEKGDLRKVATVLRSPEILSILEIDSQNGDFYYVDDWNQGDDENDAEEEDEEGGGETCLNRRLGDILPEEPVEEYPIQHWKDKNGKEWWGFNTEKGFVHFHTKNGAESGRLIQTNDLSHGVWSYLDLNGATKVED